MVIKARPKFIQDDIFNRSVWDIEENDDSTKLYFSSGGNAAGFFFSTWKKYYKRPPKIGIQTFTCMSMIEPLVSAGAEVHIFDVSLEDLSLELDQIKRVELDAIILTCYQGMMSLQYKEIAEYCKKNGILLFEDLAHGNESYIDGIKGGTLSNVYLESYCWDKPYAVIHGGSLHLNELEKAFKSYIEDEYKRVDIESAKDSEIDINTVQFLIRYTDKEHYKYDISESIFQEYPWIMSFYSEKCFERYVYRLFVLYGYKVVRRLFSRRKTKFCRINRDKIRFINAQRSRYYFTHGIETLEEYLKDTSQRLGIKKNLRFFSADKMTAWNRYSVIEETGELKEYLMKSGIDVGNFNWGKCVHQYVGMEDKSIMHGPFSNAEFASANILNIPVWCNWWDDAVLWGGWNKPYRKLAYKTISYRQAA